ncbi:MAG: thiamine pyrophosphate-binding protein [Deltaproteobacteria bacterium]|nr:thiamine pyrophosphate-binding protein [Deltaproteobacteria bacterium]
MAEVGFDIPALLALPARKEQVRVADGILRALVDRGIDKVFGIPGGAISPLYDALIDAQIDVVICQHEGMAMYMAYGYARGTGKPAVVMVTSGPGTLNTVTGTAAAKMDEVPILVLAGDVKTSMAGLGTLQDGGLAGVDVAHVMRPLTKRVEVVMRPGRAVSSIHQALDTCMARPRGPVFLCVPMDLANAQSPPPQVINEERSLPVADERVSGHIAQALAGAMRPAILLGVGARLAGVAPEVYRLAERTRCPVITDIEAKGLFPESHALSMGLVGVGSTGVAESYLAGGVDLLLTVGARLDDTTTSGFSELLRPEGTVIQLDHNPDRLNRALDYDVGVVCDLLGTMRRVEHVARAPSPFLVLSRDDAIREAKRRAPARIAPELADAPHHPGAVVRALQQLLPADTVYTTDIGNHLIFAAQYLVLDRPDCFHASIGLGGMGSGVGTAMGLAMYHGADRPVVGICGDGSLRMVGNDLATCAANDIPVVLAVFNDGQLGMVEHGNSRVFGRSAFCESPPVDVVAYARSLGAQAVRITRPRDLVRAKRLVGTGPLVLEFPIRSEVRANNPRAEVFAFPDESSR